MTQWLRKVTIQYGQDVPGSAYGPRNGWTLTSETESDLRIAFRFNRTNTNRADTGTLLIYNLPDEYRDAIDSGYREADDDRARILKGPRYRNDIEARNQELRELAQANIVKIFAGYRDDTKLIFQGDITEIKVRRVGNTLDTVTQIKLGDSILQLKYGYLQKNFGDGSSTGKTLAAIVSAAGLPASPQALAFLETSVPGLAQINMKNGLFVFGGIQYNVDQVVASMGVQWFVHNGETYFMPRGSVLPDFSLEMKDTVNVLRPVGKVSGTEIEFSMLIDGHMVPGRGFRFLTTGPNESALSGAASLPTSTFGYRADSVEYRGDTHGNSWYCMVRGSRVSVDNFPAPFFSLTPEQAVTAAGPDT